MRIDFENENESAVLEDKEKLPSADRLARTLIAFANGSGGHLVIGVRDDPREWVGVGHDKALDLEASRRGARHPPAS